jgi:glycosyltransferase involved in cell wall biosynthesis
MKVSIVITVLNEEKAIKGLLDSLARQTKKPDEIVFVDGGSADRTIQLIKAWAKKRRGAKILVKKGTTIAQGRNIGIKAAKNKIIAMTDAGCVAHPDWLEKITKPFKDPSVGIVAGFYQMTGKTAFQQVLAPYLGIPPEKLNLQNFKWVVLMKN